MKKPEALARRLLLVMSQNYSTDYTKPGKARMDALITGVTVMQEAGVSFTGKMLRMLPPAELDRTPEDLEALGTKGALVKHAQARAKLRETKGAEVVMAVLLQIRSDKMPEPGLTHQRLKLMLDVPMPLGVSVKRMCEYVNEAVKCWSGQFSPDEDPLFGFAHDEEKNPVRVRPITTADDLPKTVDGFKLRLLSAKKTITKMEALLVKVHEDLGGGK